MCKCDLNHVAPHGAIAYSRHLVGVPNWAETVNSGSVEPDQVNTCEGIQG